MKFTEFRSKVIKALDKEIQKRWLCELNTFISQTEFSPFVVDNICAEYWAKAEYEILSYGHEAAIEMVVSALVHYCEALKQ